MQRSAGILMPISSLPSPHGIGTLGRAAYDFADFLSASRQSYWQILPAGQTGFGDSPYQSVSSSAGNPYFIDLDLLTEDGLLTETEIEEADLEGDGRTVDYGRQYEARYPLLEKAFVRGFSRYLPELSAFVSENEKWLPDYALFMALKEHYENRPWQEWPDEVRLRRPEALEGMRVKLRTRIDFYTFLQFLFDKQWKALRRYVHSLGIRIIGDMPIYVSEDSVDVWASPDDFELDGDRRPIHIAGVPPDYFSEEGQRWGNPLYRWDEMKKNGYRFWIERIGAASRLYDVIRIDHFRAFASYWSIPAGEKTAKKGEWKKGPGMDFIGMILGWFSGLPIIAEDLGVLTPDVGELLRASGLPGMKVLEFAFDGRPENEYLPHNGQKNSVYYLGTHDNDTAAGWLSSLAEKEKENVAAYLGLNEKEGEVWGLIRAGQSTVSDLFIAQMQDYLGLGTKCRMNTPGVPGGNWGWRMRKEEITPALAKKIGAYTELFGRAPAMTPEKTEKDSEEKKKESEENG